MEWGTTGRGFDIVKFTDRYGVECSLQKSSLATEDCVWLGCDDIGLKHFAPGEGWKDIDTTYNPLSSEGYIANTRMHLTREQVREILPYLQHFAETGELGSYPMSDKYEM